MKYLDLFTGIGGFTYGIEKALHNEPEVAELQNERSVSSTNGNLLQRATCVGFSEIDKYAAAIYQSHYPTHHNYGDITKIDATTLPDFDLLVGGFPCQAFSIAGKRLGFDDTRGTLFFEVARILKEKRPRHFVLENVKGLLSHDGGRTFKTIISTLAELGYGVEWQVLNSKDFGVPQNRERIYIVGHLGGLAAPKVFPIPEDGGQVDEPSINQINQPKHSNDRVYRADGISPTLNTMQGGNRQPFVRITEDGFHQFRNDKKKSSIQGTHITFSQGKTHCLNTNHKPMVLTTNMQIRRLTPVECERLQGFQDVWTEYGGYKKAGEIIAKNPEHGMAFEKISDTQRYKCLGNAVTTNVVEAVIRRLYE